MNLEKKQSRNRARTENQMEICALVVAECLAEKQRRILTKY